MYHVSAQGVDERMINVHYYYYCWQCWCIVCFGLWMLCGMTPGVVIFVGGGGQTGVCVCACVHARLRMHVCVCVCVCILHIVMLEPLLLCVLGVNFWPNADNILCLRIHCVCYIVFVQHFGLYKFPLLSLYYCPASSYVQFVTGYMSKEVFHIIVDY